MTHGVHVGGAAREGRGEAVTLIDPAKGAEGSTYQAGTVEDVADAVAAARTAFPVWSALTPAERAGKLLALADAIAADADALTALEVAETGKPVPVFRDGELPFAVDNLRFFAGAGRSLEGSGAGELSQGYTSMLIRRPLGVSHSTVPTRSADPSVSGNSPRTVPVPNVLIPT